MLISKLKNRHSFIEFCFFLIFWWFKTNHISNLALNYDFQSICKLSAFFFLFSCGIVIKTAAVLFKIIMIIVGAFIVLYPSQSQAHHIINTKTPHRQKSCGSVKLMGIPGCSSAG